MFNINITTESSDTNKVKSIIGNNYPINLKSDCYGKFILITVEEQDEQMFDNNLEEIISKLELNGIKAFC